MSQNRGGDIGGGVVLGWIKKDKPKGVEGLRSEQPGGLASGELGVVEPSKPFQAEALPSDEEKRPASERGLGRSKDLVLYDPLRAYLREMRSHPPLDREEEHELAVRYRNNREIEAAYRLVTGNLWLVVKIARDYERAARSLLDLIQEGNMGLMEAVKNFDPYRGVRFPSYAVWWIRAYIIRYIIANWRLVKIGTTQAQRRLFFNLRKEKDRLEKEGFIPAPKLLAEKLNVRECDVVEMEQRLNTPEVSVDAPLKDDNETPLGAVLPSNEESAEDLLAKKQMRALLKNEFLEFAKTLNRKERVVLEDRLLGEEKATLQDLAEKLSLSRERIRQLENRIKEKLKAFLSERLGASIDGFEI